ncbi:HD domain-containing protein [Helicobacter cholecystus]|uniref:HD domain-containing protein n=1 Tax=Helicobacter cholecystus TaxID=45498 RepID=A0A3D8IXB8_9HELI|nr:HD domain-containing protein [Helicobacter cholecystus]RDU69211.1 HD domain-containing protein [Helicobacter cholecystus]VEJ24284.1 putative HAD superfamily hydrolase [Helicobacter cholecystus]
MEDNALKSPRLSSVLLRKIFVSASIRRWNDQACPVEFVELDKQAHKMVIAYFLARYEEHCRGSKIDWEKLIYFFCFEFFERMVLTDIKPPVFHKLQKHHRNELADFVIEALREDLEPYGLLTLLQEYLKNPPKCIERDILRASHFYASKWEFDIIYNFNPKMYGVENIKNIINTEVEQFYYLAGMSEIVLYQKSQEVIDMFGQLRFQKRWSQTPRVPETSVLGHTLVVAMSAYLLSLDLGVCEQMRINHFLCGLFHDLPEILTRDIISPIKHNVKGLDEQIKKIEKEAVEEKILANVSTNIKDDVIYFTQDEFSNRYKIEHFVYRVESGEEFLSKYDKDEFDPVCGEFLKFCDHLSAYLEAKISIAHGISSQDLLQGSEGIYQKCCNKVMRGVDLGKIIRDFR